MPQLKGDAGTSNPLVPDNKAGVWGESDTGYGVAGTSAKNIGVVGISSDKNIGVVTPGSLSINMPMQVGVYGRAKDPGIDTASAKATAGVIGEGMIGVIGHGSAYGIQGEGGKSGVFGRSKNIGVTGVGDMVASTGVSGFGVEKGSTGVAGIGEGDHAIGILAQSDNGIGLSAESKSGPAIYAQGHNDFGLIVDGPDTCAFFLRGAFIHDNLTVGNDLNVDGQIYLGGFLFCWGIFTLVKSFRIDHPKKPSEMYLQHASVESPDYKTFYDGIVILDSAGEAVVELPDWFDSLNGNLRYQLTCIGTYAPIYIAEEVKNNHFKIAGGRPGIKVSWQITGIRQDPYALANPMEVELEKNEQERGLYLSPEAYNQPKEKGIWWQRKEANSKTIVHERIRRPVPPVRPRETENSRK